MNLREKIEANNKVVESAKENYLIALREYEGVKNPIKKQHQDMLDKFRRTINSEIEAGHTCDCCRPNYYDDAWFTDDGISMRIDADHPNDIIDTDWTWEEVEKVLSA